MVLLIHLNSYFSSECKFQKKFKASKFLIDAATMDSIFLLLFKSFW